MAQFNLGVVYAKGEGVPTEYMRAYAWLSTVAARGNANDKNPKKLPPISWLRPKLPGRKRCPSDFGKNTLFPSRKNNADKELAYPIRLFAEFGPRFAVCKRRPLGCCRQPILFGQYY